MCGDLDDDQEHNKTPAQYNEDDCSDDLLNISMPDSEFLDDELSEVLPFPQRFIQMIRESAPSMLNDQVVSDTILANVIYETFPQLLSQPDIPVVLDQFLTYIMAQRQPYSQSTTPFVPTPLEPKPLVQPQTQLKSGKPLKDPKAHRMKNRPFGLKYNKDKSNKGPKNAPSAKTKKKTKKAEDDYITKAAKQQRRDHDDNGSGGGIGGTCAC